MTKYIGTMVLQSSRQVWTEAMYDKSTNHLQAHAVVDLDLVVIIVELATAKSSGLKGHQFALALVRMASQRLASMTIIVATYLLPSAQNMVVHANASLDSRDPSAIPAPIPRNPSFGTTESLRVSE